MKFSRFFLIILSVLALALGMGSPSLAQTAKEPAGFTNVVLWVNPEYDDPRLLVMLQGKITGADAPATVRFLVPTAAEMYSAGSIDAQGKYSGGPPQRTASQIPGWDEISYQVKTDTFRVEYYDPVITAEADKKFAYDFRTLYPIADLRVVIQEPRKSTGFQVTPEGLTGADSEGFAVHSYTYTNIAPGSPLHFDISYTKTDPHPSLVDSSGSVPDVSNASSPNIPLIIGIIAAVGAGIAILFQFRKPAPKRQRVSARNRSPGRHSEQGKYCPRCGSPVEPSHRFCPDCGRKLD